MSQSTLQEWLVESKACQPALDWLGTRTLKQAWADCEDPQRMLWLLEKLAYNDEQTLRLYACWCAANTPLGDGRVTWDLLTDNRSRKAILVSINYANGEATAEELAAARDAADAAWAALDAWAAGDAAWAAWAVWAAGAARAAAGDAAGDAARDAAWDAARAARADAGDAGAARAARDVARMAQAVELRRRIPYSVVAKLARKVGIR